MKPWYKSRTIWAAVLTGIIGVAVAVAGGDVVSTEVAGGILVAVGLLEAVLRMITTEPLRLS